MAIGMTNAGGIRAWAFVIVNYPSGSTLTATNVSGKIDISSTQRIYYVRKPLSGTTQSCVFTISNSTTGQTKTHTVSGITIGTSRAITLAYSLDLYYNGVLDPSVGTSLVRLSDNTVFRDESVTDKLRLYVNTGVNVEGRARYDGALDLTYYSTLTIKLAVSHAHNDYMSWIGFVDSTYTTGDFNAVCKFDPTDGVVPAQTATLDISSLTTGMYLAFRLPSFNASADFNIERLTLT